jgi:hypothetical protein
MFVLNTLLPFEIVFYGFNYSRIYFSYASWSSCNFNHSYLFITSCTAQVSSIPIVDENDSLVDIYCRR